MPLCRPRCRHTRAFRGARYGLKELGHDHGEFSLFAIREGEKKKQAKSSPDQRMGYNAGMTERVFTYKVSKKAFGGSDS
jgi:hypothetical protein